MAEFADEVQPSVSEIHSIDLLVRYKSQSLIEHVRRGWSISHRIAGHFVTVVPPRMGDGPDWFRSTADAVHQNRGLIDPHSPDLVAVFGSDHMYRMDINQMVRFHLERNAGSEFTGLIYNPVFLKKTGRDAKSAARLYRYGPRGP